MIDVQAAWPGFCGPEDVAFDVLAAWLDVCVSEVAFDVQTA